MPLDIKALAARLEELNKPRGGGGGPGMSFIKIKDGRNVYRILPPLKEEDMFFEEVWVHYGVGKSDKNKKGTMIVCPKTKDENEYCPVCELSSQYRKLSKKKDDHYSKEARQVYRKKRVYYNAIDRDEDLSVYELRDVEGEESKKWFNKDTDEEETPVKVLAAGVEVFKGILGYIVDPEYGDITDPVTGLDIIVTKTGTTQYDTNYDVKAARKESPIGFDKWKESMHDLKALAKPKTVKEIEDIMEGKESGSSGGTTVREDKPAVDEKPVDISDPAGTEESEVDADAAIAAALARRRAAKDKQQG